MTRRWLPVCLAVLSALSGAWSGETGGEWTAVFSVRFDNVDDIDARDGDASGFLSGIGVDGVSTPPLRTLVGPLLKNPYFSAFAADAWLEGTLFIPTRPGSPAWVWAFPADNQSDYRAALERQGLVDIESMDETLILGEFDGEGEVAYWHLDWLPGDVAVFGADLGAVRAARELYETSGAAHGRLSSRQARAFSPDFRVWFSPGLFAAWQDRESGVYWWRTQIMRLADELVGHWLPEAARTRLIGRMAEDAAALPLSWREIDLSLWIGRDGLEWRLDLLGSFPERGAASELSTARRLPGEIVQGLATAFSRERIAGAGDLVGRLLLEGAGGAVPAAVREEAGAIRDMLVDAGIRQAAVGWLQRPAAAPLLGSARLMIVECGDVRTAESAWRRIEEGIAANAAIRQTFAQIGWDVSVSAPNGAGGARTVRIAPVQPGAPYVDLLAAARTGNGLIALAWSENPPEGELRAAGMERLAAMAEEALRGTPSGSGGIREAFTLMGADGADFLGVLFPVGLMQMALAENADWRALAPDEPEPESTRLAREALEYRDAGPPWSAVGEKIEGGWRVNGTAAWSSLLAFAAALGLTDYLSAD